jgi:hypothetical protein
VTDYIPQYGRHGKGGTTIGLVLAHRAAVPSLPPRLLDLESLADRDLVIKAICDAKPFVKPGTRLAYHPIQLRPDAGRKLSSPFGLDTDPGAPGADQHHGLGRS